MGITGLQIAAKVTADTADAEAGLKRVGDNAEHSSGGLKGLLSNMLAIAGGITITNAAGDAFGFVKDQLTDSVKVAGDYQQAQAQLTQGLKSTNGASGETVKGLLDLADAYSKTTTFSSLAIQQSEAVTLTFTNIGKKVFPQVTQAAMDMATRMGTDLPTATLQLDKALNDPAKRYAALQRVGVTFTQSQIDSMKAMEANGNMAGAQAVMLQELQKEFGGSADAAGNTFAGALQIAQNQLEDTKDKVGSALLPVLAQLLKVITPIVAALSQGLATVLPVVIGWVTNLFGSLQPLIAALPNLWEQVENIGLIFMNGLQPALAAVASAFSGLSGPAGGTSSIVQQISVDLGRAAPLFYALGQAISQGVTTALPILGALWQIFTKDLIPIFMQTWNIIQTDGLPILLLLAGIFAKQVIPAIASVADWVNTHLMPAIKLIADFIKTTVAPIFSNLVSIFTRDVLPAVENIATAITDQLLPPIVSIASKVLPVLNPLFSVLGWIVSHVVGPAIGLAINLVAGLATGLDGVIGFVGGVISAFGGIAGAVGSAFGGLWNIIKTPINQAIDGINVLIRGLDNIHFDIPSWVPGLGGDGFGINIATIPHLAAGTDDFQGGPALIGEGGTPELVTGPTLAKLAKGSQVIPVSPALAAGLTPAYGAASASQGGQGVPIIIQIDGRTIAQIVLQNAPTVLRNATGQRAM